jgi:transcriptional regulator with XRE-family HTH domain
MKPSTEEIILRDFGKRFKALRKLHKLTQEAFEVDSSTIRRIETGKINPSYLLLQKISATFQCSTSEFLERIDKIKT